MATRNPVSSANLGGHPIHPMLIPFPIVLFLATLFCDVAYWLTGQAGWTTAAIWLLGLGLIGAAAAALAGLTDFMGDSRIRDLSDAWQHAIGNVVAVLISAFSWYWRYRYGAAGVLPVGVICSIIVALILLFTGWKGGDLVYRHRVAVYDEPSAP